MEIRVAWAEELDEIMKIYAEARAFMAEAGNPDQWGDGYPERDMIEGDIAEGKLYVCAECEKLLAVFYYAAEDDKTYHVIDGGWLSDAEYGVVHRIAVRERGRGIAAACINWAYGQTGNIRIDTHADNIPMQKLLAKLGFTYCGTIYVRDGSPRRAYQKIK